MSKKVIGALLAIVMVLSVFSLTVFAVGKTSYEDKPEDYSQVWSLSEPEVVDAATKTYKVNVLLQTDYYVGPVQFEIGNVSSVTKVDLGSGYYAGTKPQYNTKGLVILVPSTSAVIPGIKAVASAPIAVVTYVAKGDNDNPIIVDNQKTAANPGGTLFAARLEGSTAVNSANFVFGQKTTVNSVGNIPEPPAQDVTLTGKNGSVVDDTNGYVYGIPVGTEDVASCFTTTGYIEMVPNAVDNTNGTGATLKLYSDSSKATLVKSYTVVIFGDADGDAEVSLKDAKKVQDYANYVNLDMSDLAKFAVNLDADTEISLKDAKKIQDYANYVNLDLTVNPWA